jgi:flagellar L-ring protein precursor FlgH
MKRMKRESILSGIFFVFLLGAFFLYLPQAAAGSLWNDRTNWVADQRPSRVGDIVNVIVNESTTTEDKGKTDLKKDSTSTVSDGRGILDFIRSFGLDTTTNAKGDGSTNRNHYARTIIPCMVIETLPNGNLVLEGVRDLKTNEENLQVHFVGVVRPQDIDGKNQIHSNLVANAEISVEGKGLLARVQKPGILTQVLQTIF